jgi:adenosylcobinamide-GDP ribazoletransferase
MPPLVASVLAIGFSILATGAFHEDGLADTFDSFGAFNTERRLEIMKDSRIGTFGTLALLINVTVSVAALASLEGKEGFLAIILAHSLSRVASIIVLTIVKPAKQEGLGSSYSLFSFKGSSSYLFFYFAFIKSGSVWFDFISGYFIDCFFF